MKGSAPGGVRERFELGEGGVSFGRRFDAMGPVLVSLVFGLFFDVERGAKFQKLCQLVRR